MRDGDIKKPWASPKIIDVGSIDAQTTFGDGNIGDQGTQEKHWKPALPVPDDAEAVLPEGE